MNNVYTMSKKIDSAPVDKTTVLINTVLLSCAVIYAVGYFIRSVKK